MIRLALITGILLIGNSCSSLNFDSLAFDRFVSISERADKLSTQCDSYGTIKSGTAVMLDNVTHMDLYGQHRGASPEVAGSVRTLHSMVQELNDKYADGVVAPSEVYCKEKLAIISRTAGSISDTLGRLN